MRRSPRPRARGAGTRAQTRHPRRENAHSWRASRPGMRHRRRRRNRFPAAFPGARALRHAVRARPAGARSKELDLQRLRGDLDLLDAAAAVLALFRERATERRKRVSLASLFALEGRPARMCQRPIAASFALDGTGIGLVRLIETAVRLECDREVQRRNVPAGIHPFRALEVGARALRIASMGQRIAAEPVVGPRFDLPIRRATGLDHALAHVDRRTHVTSVEKRVGEIAQRRAIVREAVMCLREVGDGPIECARQGEEVPEEDPAREIVRVRNVWRDRDRAQDEFQRKRVIAASVRVPSLVVDLLRGLHASCRTSAVASCRRKWVAA